VPVTRTTITVRAETHEKLKEKSRDDEALYETVDRALNSLEE
jgi:hypothetical protein